MLTLLWCSDKLLYHICGFCDVCFMMSLIITMCAVLEWPSEINLAMHCCRKTIKDDMERSRGSSVKHVNTPAVSRLPPSVPFMTPVSTRLSLPNAASSAVSSRNSSTAKSHGSLPLCGNSFFEDNDADQSCSNWSAFSSFDVSNIESLDAPSVLSTSKVMMRSCEANTAASCIVHCSQSETLAVTAAPAISSSGNTWLTSQQANTSVTNSSLPASGVARQKPSLIAAAMPACSSPSGLTNTFLSDVAR